MITLIVNKFISYLKNILKRLLTLITFVVYNHFHQGDFMKTFFEIFDVEDLIIMALVIAFCLPLLGMTLNLYYSGCK